MWTDAGDRRVVMRLVEGGTVAERLEHGAAGLDCKALARGVLTALAHVPLAGIVHRDVKPGNVLIDHDGRFRPADFGLADPRPAADALAMRDGEAEPTASETPRPHSAVSSQRAKARGWATWRRRSGSAGGATGGWAWWLR